MRSGRDTGTSRWNPTAPALLCAPWGQQAPLTPWGGTGFFPVARTAISGKTTVWEEKPALLGTDSPELCLSDHPSPNSQSFVFRQGCAQHLSELPALPRKLFSLRFMTVGRFQQPHNRDIVCLSDVKFTSVALAGDHFYATEDECGTLAQGRVVRRTRKHRSSLPVSINVALGPSRWPSACS